MRTAKYYDYTVLRIILFIILVIVGLFLYFKFVKSPCDHIPTSDGWIVSNPTCTEDGYRYKVCSECGEQFDNQTIDALGHKPTEAVKENEKPHTETEGGSYELVVTCSECGEMISRETVMVDGAHTPEIVETKENVKDPTCTEDGSYELVTFCKGCDFELSRETVIVDALGHSDTYEEKTENLVESTCTAEGSYDLVKICKTCGVEVSRENKVIPIEHKFEVVESKENDVPPTCTEQGSYDIVHSCSGCGAELSRETHTVEPTGHNFGEYNFIYDYTTGKVSLYVVCDNDGSTSVITEDDGLVVARDESKPACCLIRYTVSYTYGEFKVEEVVDFEPVPHKVVYTRDFVEGEAVNDSYDLPAPEIDAETGKEYYNIDVLPGIVLYVPVDGSVNEWDANGFALGAFRCDTCGDFYVVRIYSAKYDTRINNGTNE